MNVAKPLMNDLRQRDPTMAVFLMRQAVEGMIDEIMMDVATPIAKRLENLRKITDASIGAERYLADNPNGFTSGV